MKALSVRQPWAWAIIEGHKQVENRRWYPGHFSGRFAIHASSTFDLSAYDWILDNIPGINMPSPEQLLLGGIIGTVLYTGFVRSPYNNPWFRGPYGWLLSDAKRVTFIQCKGNLNMWDIDIQEMDVLSSYL